MPRRHDNLFEAIAHFGALHAAARSAVKGKRRKSGAASFFANLEGELLSLERQLLDGSYRPGRYVAFEVNDPKKRMVSAAPFRHPEAWTAPCRRVLRGGSWNNNPDNLRSANRNRNTTDNRNNNNGFRVGSTLSARAGAITVAPGEH